jgi:hypothetical protein
MKQKLLAIGLALFGSVSTQAASPAVMKVNFTSHVATRYIGYFDPGEAAVITALVKPNTRTDALVHTIKFRPRLDGVTLTAAWHVGTATSPVRLLGVNIDLIDASGALLASDTFTGLLSGVAHSTLTYSGLDRTQTYRLVLTGTRATSAAYSLVLESL